jgi:integrase
MRGHVRKRGRLWAFVVELDRDSITGKRRQRWVSGFSTKAEAERELRKRLHLLDDGEDPFPSEIAVREFITERWLIHLETQGRVRVRTVRSYRQLMRDHILPKIGMMQLRKVRPAHVQAVLDDMTGRGRAPRTVAHARAAMSAAFAQAVKWQLVSANPVRATEAPAKKSPDLHIPSPDELAAIIEAARGTPWEVPILLSATTAARRGEVLAITWGNVDLDRARVRIVSSLQRVNKEWQFVPPKTSHGVRSVPLLPQVVDRLRKHRAEQAQRLLRLGMRVSDEHVVCDRGDGAPIDPSTYTHAASRIIQSAGVPNARLHDLRHAVATALAASRNRPEVTSKLLGHASVGFTLSTYTHVTDDDLDVVTQKLGEVLGT